MDYEVTHDPAPAPLGSDLRVTGVPPSCSSWVILLVQGASRRHFCLYTGRSWKGSILSSNPSHLQPTSRLVGPGTCQETQGPTGSHQCAWRQATQPSSSDNRTSNETMIQLQTLPAISMSSSLHQDTHNETNPPMPPEHHSTEQSPGSNPINLGTRQDPCPHEFLVTNPLTADPATASWPGSNSAQVWFWR